MVRGMCLLSFLRAGRARAAVSRLETRKRSRASILKLNDDIMAVEGKLRQFETDNSDRTRLTDRKANSANRLLKEEKFRKDSQARCAAELASPYAWRRRCSRLF